MEILRLIGIGLGWGTLFIVIGAAVGGLIVYSRLNNEVQKHVLAELQKRYPDLDIQVGSAHVVENRGLTVKDIEFSVAQHSGQSRKLLYIGEMFVECPITLASLYQRNPRISRVVVKNPLLRASRAADGTFAELRLLSNDEGWHFFFPEIAKPVVVEIENGMLLYDDARQPSPPLRFSGISLAVTPEIQEQTRRIAVKGTADGDFIRRIDFEALSLPETEQWQFTANCRQFDWSDDLWKYLPPNPYFAERPLFQGRFDFHVSAVSDPLADAGYRFALGGSFTHGRLDFPEIDRTLTELSTRFEVTNERVVIDRLTGSSDSARFTASYVQEGLTSFGDPQQKAECTINVRDLRFDEALLEALAPFLNDETERLLAQYEYEGMTDLHAQLLCQDGKWHPKNLSMKISDIGFAFRAFPYRLDRLTGTLLIDDTSALHMNFTSKQEAPFKAVISGYYSNIFVDATGKVEIIGENVPIDSKLFRALPLATQEVVNSLRPTGNLNARLILELPPGDVPVKRQFDIALDHVSLRYDHFPYPLRDVGGSLHYNDDVWEFRDVSGINGTAVVKGGGHLRPIDGVYSAAQEFVLHVSAEELSLDEQLIQALLKPDQRQLLQSLNANGKVNLEAQIQYRTDDKELNLCFQAIPRPGLSFYPDRFPYKIDDVAGKIEYENGRVFAETLTGTHRNTKLRSGLDCRFDVEGKTVLLFSPLEIDQLQADRELLDALPKHLQNALDSMQITNPFNLSGGIEYRQTAHGEQAVQWNVKCILHQNSMKLGMSFENIFGIVRLTGYSIADQLRLDGELHLDLLMVSGFYVTDVRGPFTFDNKRLWLGVAENRLNPEVVPRPLTGKFCGGTIHTDGLVILDNGISYNVNANLIGADLEKIAQVVEPASQKTSGKVNCTNVNLRGIGTKWETVSGTGTIQLRDANIYGAPVMVRLLRELRIKETDPNAGMFSSVDYNFRLSGLQMFFDPIVFEGGLISMYGDGMMRLDNRHVDLTLKTRLGNRRSQIPVISDIIGGVSDQLVQLRVTGPLADPIVTRVVVPEIQNALQQIQPEEPLPPQPAPRSRLSPSRLFPWNPL